MQTGSDFRLTDQAKYAITFVSLDRFQQCFGFFLFFCFVLYITFLQRCKNSLTLYKIACYFQFVLFFLVFLQPAEVKSVDTSYHVNAQCSPAPLLSAWSLRFTTDSIRLIFVPVLVLALFLNYNLHSLHDCLLEIFHNNTKMHSKVYQNSWNFSLCKFDCQTVEGQPKLAN